MQELPKAPDRKYVQRTRKKKRNRPGKRRNPFLFSTADSEELTPQSPLLQVEGHVTVLKRHVG